MMNIHLNRTSCFAKGVVHGGRIGQELLLLAERARGEGKISSQDWQKNYRQHLRGW